MGNEKTELKEGGGVWKIWPTQKGGAGEGEGPGGKFDGIGKERGQKTGGKVPGGKRMRQSLIGYEMKSRRVMRKKKHTTGRAGPGKKGKPGAEHRGKTTRKEPRSS